MIAFYTESRKPPGMTWSGVAWSFHLDAAAWLAPWRLQGRTLKDNRLPLVNPLLGEFWKFGSLGWAGVNNSSWFLGLAFLAARL